VQLELAASQLAELGHTTRLSIFRLLVRAGRQGMAVGDIQSQLDIPGSTLSHHLSRLSQAGLMTQQRDGRTLYCQLNFAQIQLLLAFLTAECCALDTTAPQPSEPCC